MVAYDYKDENGDRIVESHGMFGVKSKLNLDKLFQPGPRRSENVRLLVHEALMRRQGATGNWAEPINRDVYEQFLREYAREFWRLPNDIESAAEDAVALATVLEQSETTGDTSE